MAVLRKVHGMNRTAAALKGRLSQLTHGDVLQTRLVKVSATSVLLKVVDAALRFGTIAVPARLLGPENLGVYAFALAVIMMLGMPAKACVPQLVTRETTKGKAEKGWNTVKGGWRWGGGLVLAVPGSGIFVAPQQLVAS